MWTIWLRKWYNYSGKHFSSFLKKKNKYIPIMRFISCTLKHLFQWNENLSSQKSRNETCINAYDSLFIIFKLETVQISFNRVKQTVVYPYHKYHSAIKKYKPLIHTTTWMNCQGRNFGEWKKLILNGFTLYISIYILLKWQNCWDGE